MATSKSTPRPTPESAADLLHTKLSQADALATILCGEGGESFRRYSDDIQDRVLWLLSSTLREGMDALKDMTDRPKLEVVK